MLWHSKDLIIKTALKTGGDVLHKKVSISDDLDILKESQLEPAASKIPEMLASSEPGDNQVGNYFDPKGELFRYFRNFLLACAFAVCYRRSLVFVVYEEALKCLDPNDLAMVNCTLGFKSVIA